MYIGVQVKYPLRLSDFNQTAIFLADFFKNTQISNFIKILPGGAGLFHADGRTEGRTDGHDEGNSRFSQFCGRS
jgi:hypothetical protein